MISSPILYNENATIIAFVVCCLIVLAVVMIPKAVRHRKRVKATKNDESVQGKEQKLEVIVVPDGIDKMSCYKDRFLFRNEIKKRGCVYISREMHYKIMMLTKALDSVTIGGYVDAVLREHLKEYKDEINTIYLDSRKDLL